MKTFIPAFLFIMTIIIGLTLTSVFSGFLMGVDFMEKKAIENNAAKWVCDPTTGKKTLEWITK